MFVIWLDVKQHVKWLFTEIHCQLFNRITLGQNKSDNNNRMIQLTYAYWVPYILAYKPTPALGRTKKIKKKIASMAKNVRILILKLSKIYFNALGGTISCFNLLFVGFIHRKYTIYL